jgi:protein-L-isoaspartate(D-aspartate) O-methyltransferase
VVVISLLGAGMGGSTAEERKAEEERRKMVALQIERRGIHEERVLRAMREVPRHEFVPRELRESAHDDCALPIGFGQTISQPYIVGLTLAHLALHAEDCVLEVGAGSGYQAAILSRLVAQVFAIEIVEELVRRAIFDLQRLHYDNVQIRNSDGYQGWLERAPFDSIAVAAALDHVPHPLVTQLRTGGRMVIPIGNATGQQLMLVEKGMDGVRMRPLCPVRFVPFTRKALD